MSRGGLSTPLSILSINVGKCSSSHELALSTAFDSSVDVLMVQEPRLFSELNRRITKKHPSFECFSPVDTFENTPRVMTYVRRGVGLRATQERLLPQEDEAANDLLFLTIRTSTNQSLMTVNVYNAPQGNSNRVNAAITSLMSLPPSYFPSATFIAGDFNLHHSLWHPSYSGSPTPLADPFVSWIESQDLSFISQVDKPTQQSGNVLDLAFASSTLRYRGATTRVKRKLQISSDHLPLLTNILWDDRARERPTRLRLATLEEETFTSLLKCNLDSILSLPTPLTANSLDEYASDIVEATQKAYQGSARRALPHNIGQPWWNEACTLAVQAFRAARRGQYGFATDEAKKELRRVTRKAKESFYKKKLDEAATSKDVFDITKWHKSTGSFRSPPLRDPLRPQDPPATSLEAKGDVLARNLLRNAAEAGDIPLTASAVPKTSLPFPDITEQEVEKAILGAGNTTPGKDEIPTPVLRLGWPLLKKHVFKLFQACIQIGYHPSCFRTAILAILSKPNKADRSSPRSYRPIALLSVLGKGLERLVAKRMSWVAIKYNVLAPQQFGALPLRSSVDLTTCLTHDIETALNQGLTASVLTLDVKGAFDAVLPGRLVRRLREQGWPSHLCEWVASFATNRKVCIRLDGEIGDARTIECGLPQGSPVSPILFMLYISPLFFLDQLRDGFGYADDVASCKISPSLQENSLALSATLAQALEWGRLEGITFDPEKSELIHFSRKRADKNNSPSIEVGSFTVSESTERPYLKWLGVLFDRKLTFKHHVLTQASKALKTARALSSLGNTLRGVSPTLTRQAIEACVLSVAYFAAETWWPGRKRQTYNGYTSNGVDNLIEKLGKVTLTSARSILPVFSTTPSSVLYRESGLSPPELKLDEIALRATVRIRRLDPQHPLRTRAYAIQGPLIPTRRSRKVPTRFARRFLTLPPSEQLDTLALPPWFVAESREEAKTRIGAPDAALTKEQRASAFTHFIRQIPTNDIIVYTDGSKLQNGNAGAGYAISQFGVTHKESYPLGPSAEIFDAEAIAALLGVRAALLHPLNRLAKDVWVCLDNLEVALRLLSPSPTTSQSVFTSLIEARKAWKRRGLVSSDGDIHIRWVPGHAAVPGNELADIEARKGSSQLPSSPLPLSFASLKRWQALQATNARSEWWATAAHENYRLLSINTAPVPPKELRLPRRELSRILAARSNHGDFKDYHERFNHTEAELYCSCGSPKSRFHFFFCRIARRRASRPQGPPSTLIPQLLGTGEGISLLTEWWRRNRFYEDTCPYRKLAC